jgi:hypothetical protein
MDSRTATFAPSWISGRGLSVVRQLPTSVPRALADDARGRALAALRCAADRAFRGDLDKALDVQGSLEQHIELTRLARGHESAPGDLVDVLRASLDARTAA